MHCINQYHIYTTKIAHWWLSLYFLNRCRKQNVTLRPRDLGSQLGYDPSQYCISDYLGFQNGFKVGNSGTIHVTYVLLAWSILRNNYLIENLIIDGKYSKTNTAHDDDGYAHIYFAGKALSSISHDAGYALSRRSIYGT